MDKFKTEIWCSLQIEGMHNWETCDLQPVEYLKHPHRHIFHIKAFKLVTHSDRDIEFINLKHEINKYLIGQYWSGWSKDDTREGYGLCVFGSMSCEMMAAELIEQFNLIRCEVSEDGENGAIVINTSN